MLPDMGPSPYPGISPFDINVTEVTKLLQEVDKPTGPDGIPPRLLKEMHWLPHCLRRTPEE